MANKEKAQFCFDNSLRLEIIIHLGSMCYDETFPDAAAGAFEFDPEDVWAAIGIDSPEYYADKEEVALYLIEQEKQGFLVQWATPVPTFYKHSTISRSSWGFSRLDWVYADTFDEAFECARQIASLIMSAILTALPIPENPMQETQMMLT